MRVLTMINLNLNTLTTPIPQIERLTTPISKIGLTPKYTNMGVA